MVGLSLLLVGCVKPAHMPGTRLYPAKIKGSDSADSIVIGRVRISKNFVSNNLKERKKYFSPCNLFLLVYTEKYDIDIGIEGTDRSAKYYHCLKRCDGWFTVRLPAGSYKISKIVVKGTDSSKLERLDLPIGPLGFDSKKGEVNYIGTMECYIPSAEEEYGDGKTYSGNTVVTGEYRLRLPGEEEDYPSMIRNIVKNKGDWSNRFQSAVIDEYESAQSIYRKNYPKVIKRVNKSLMYNILDKNLQIIKETYK